MVEVNVGGSRTLARVAFALSAGGELEELVEIRRDSRIPSDLIAAASRSAKRRDVIVGNVLRVTRDDGVELFSYLDTGERLR